MFWSSPNHSFKSAISVHSLAYFVQLKLSHCDLILVDPACPRLLLL